MPKNERSKPSRAGRARSRRPAARTRRSPKRAEESREERPPPSPEALERLRARLRDKFH